MPETVVQVQAPAPALEAAAVLLLVVVPAAPPLVAAAVRTVAVETVATQVVKWAEAQEVQTTRVVRSEVVPRVLKQHQELA